MIFVLESHEVDAATREIRGPDGPIHVEPRVLDTLLYLLRHRERVVSRQELVDRVWDVGHVTDSAVTRSVMAARRALGDDGSTARTIKTYYGRGYRFVAPVEMASESRAVSEPAAKGPRADGRPATGGHFRRLAWPVAATLLTAVVTLSSIQPGDPAGAISSAAAETPRAEASRREVARALVDRAVTRWEPVCDNGGSTSLLRTSVDLDPESPAAWSTLAGRTASDAKHCGARPGSLRRAREALDRAVALDREASVALSFRPVISLWEGDVSRSWDELEAARERFPDDLALRLTLATALRYAGFLEESRELHDRLVEEFPALPWVAAPVPHAHLYLLDWEAARPLMPAESTPFFRFYRAYLDLMAGNPEAAAATLEGAWDAHPGDLYGRLCQALLASIRGADEEARVLLTHLVRQRAQTGVDAEVTFEIARLLVMARDEAEGVAQLARAVEDGFFCPDCYEKDPTLERLQGDPRYEAVISRATERHREFARSVRYARRSEGMGTSREPSRGAGTASGQAAGQVRAATRFTLR